MKQKHQEVDRTRDAKDSVKDSGQRNGTEQARESHVTQGVLTPHGWLRGQSRMTRFCPWLPEITHRNRRTCRGEVSSNGSFLS